MRRSRIALVILMAGALAGCGGEESTQPKGPPLPATPDDLIREFKAAYDVHNLDLISDLLTEDFVFQFSPRDVAVAGTDSAWSRDEEIACAERMFGGAIGVYLDGTPRASIDLIYPFGVILFPRDSAWTARSDPPYAGALSRVYDAGMQIQFEDGSLDIVQGRQEFFVTDGVTTEDGLPRDGYAFAFWRDIGVDTVYAVEMAGGGKAALHTASWGWVKALFRGP